MGFVRNIEVGSDGLIICGAVGFKKELGGGGYKGIEGAGFGEVRIPVRSGPNRSSPNLH